MKITIYPSDSRGYADHGWLKTHHSFSFADYYEPSRMRFGVLRVLNDDYLAGGKGFGLHPHDNMEIITVMLDGQIRHKDNMGNEMVLTKNEVQVMSAGSGVMHSEFNNDPKNPLSLLQIWIYPSEKDIEPEYHQKEFEPNERINKWQKLVSPKGNEGLTINQNAYLNRVEMSKDKDISYTLHTNDMGCYIFVIEGKIKIEENIISKRDAIGITETENIKIKAIENSDVLLIEVPMKNS